MNLTPSQPFELKTEQSYAEHLVHTTRFGLWANVIALGFYTLLYRVQGFAVGFWIDLSALVVAIIALAIAYATKRMALAANLAVFGFFIATVGLLPFDGGMFSPSMSWCFFMVIFATITAGIRAGLIWSGVTLSSMIAIYFLQDVVGINMWLKAPSALERLIEYLGLLASVTIAILWSESIKRKKYKQLEELQQHLNYLANIDTLTDVFNRRYLQNFMQNMLQSEATLILFDLDWFKSINDTYGHRIGDQVLKEIAKLTARCLRKSDILARFGGEEFVILMPQTTLQEGISIAKRLHGLIEQTPVQVDGLHIYITASFGVASTLGDERADVEKLLQRADQAMYAAKEAGRNQIFVWRDGKPISHRFVFQSFAGDG